jgi:hypothetical protein
MKNTRPATIPGARKGLCPRTGVLFTPTETESRKALGFLVRREAAC